MKRLSKALGGIAAAALLVSPISATAQGHGGMGGHGGFGGGGRGGGWHGASVGGWHGSGWRGGGWDGGRFHGDHFHHFGGFFPFFGAFALGAAFASPWYYWGDPWWYWGPGPYPYDGYYGDYDYGPPPPPPPANSAPAACGRWVWRADQSHYQWVPTPCAAPPAEAAPAPPPAPRG